MRKRLSRIAPTLGGATMLLLAALARTVAAAEAVPFALTSPAFEAGDAIPTKQTCAGDGVSPPLAWSGVPAAALSLALVVDDPDAPDPAAPKMTWVHWVLYNIPPSAGALDEGVANLPAGTRAGLSDFKRMAYGGPCPPVGRHRYFHKLYALDVVLPNLGQPTKAALEAAMKGHIVGQAVLIGTYGKGE